MPFPDAKYPFDQRLVAAAPDLLETMRFIVPTLYSAARATPMMDSDGVNLLLEAADEASRAIHIAEEGGA